MSNRRYANMDAAESLFFARELEFVKAQTYDVLYADLRAREFIPVSHDAPSGAEVITFTSYDSVGQSKMIGSYADDLPRVDVFGTQTSSKVKGLGDAFGYSLQEVRAAMMANKPLAALKAQAARRVLEEQIDLIAALGNTASGLVGFLNHSSVPSASVATVSSLTTWAQKQVTPSLIVADINEQVGTMIAASKGKEMPDSLLVPIEQFVLLSQTQMSSNSDLTVLEFVKKSMPWLKNVDHWYRLDGAGSGSTDRMVMYKKDPGKLTMEIPQEFEQLDVQEQGLEFVTPCHARTGGCILYYPYSVSYRDGI